jgi:hypothetical protein
MEQHQMEQRWVLRIRQARSQMGQQNQRAQMERRFRWGRLIWRQDLSQQLTIPRRVRKREHRMELLLNQMGRQMVLHYQRRMRLLQPRLKVLLSHQREQSRKAIPSPTVLERRYHLGHGKQHR